MEDRRLNGALRGVRAVERDVVATLDAQLAAAVARECDPRPSRRRVLAEEHRALAFVPALGAVHGLASGRANLYRITSFDLLYVWKLGIFRLLAQRLPTALRSWCQDPGGARLGSVAAILDGLNLRGFPLCRNCLAAPAPPGYVGSFFARVFNQCKMRLCGLRARRVCAWSAAGCPIREPGLASNPRSVRPALCLQGLFNLHCCPS